MIIKEPTPYREPRQKDTKEVKDEDQFSIESLVNLVTVYTGYTKGQARNIITAVISKKSANLIGDVIDWCVHIKEVQNDMAIIELVAKGEALVERHEGKFKLIEKVGNAR